MGFGAIITAGESFTVIDSIERGREQLIMPWLARVMPATRILPVRGFDRVMDFFGINHTMDHFTGRTRATPSRADVDQS